MKMRMIYTENAQDIHARSLCKADKIQFDGPAFYFEFTDVTKSGRQALERLTREMIFEIICGADSTWLLRLIDPQKLLHSDPYDDFPDLKPCLSRMREFFKGRKQANWPLKHGMLNWDSGPLIMGIVNVTPDSFSDGGKYNTVDSAVDHARRLIDEGSDILDIGGESSRPGAEPVSREEELKRVIPVIEAIRRFSDIPISIDTYKSAVAREALKAGADIINDISGTEFDTDMETVLREERCPIIIMHMRGTPKTMQDAPEYRDVVAEVYDYFEKKIKHLASLNDGQIILDPGIGFGKRLEHNLSLIRNMRDFSFLGYPLLTGVSRKSFLGHLLGLKVEERIFATKYVELTAMMKGSAMIRTHDVREAVEARAIFRALY